MSQFLNLFSRIHAGKVKFEDPCMPVSISLLFLSVTRALQDPMNLSASVNLKQGNWRTDQIGIRADFLPNEAPCSLCIGYLLPLAVGFHLIPDFTIEASKITEEPEVSELS
jgi:hypothetical protein